MNEEYNECIPYEFISVAATFGVSEEALNLSTEYEPSALSTTAKPLMYKRWNEYYKELLKGNELAKSFVYNKVQQEMYLYATFPCIDVAMHIFNRCLLIKQIVNVRSFLRG